MVRRETLSPGAMVDHFKVVRLLGKGGFGEVFLARDTKLGRKVALKVINREHLDSEEALQRFLFEARATARFNHPHIVTVYAVGESEGVPYVALEYLQGQTLRERMREQLPALKEGIRIGLAVAQALCEAHRHKILHRDLKPENILLPADGRLRVVDFGLAKRIDRVELRSPGSGLAPDADPAELSVTLPVADPLVEGELGTTPPDGEVEIGTDGERTIETPGFDSVARRSVRGTPIYMAPEQWHAESGSEATDLWALGVILYELVSGQLPFQARRMDELAGLVCSDVVAPTLEGEEVPAALRRLVQRCLEKDPGRRPTAATAVETLEELLGGSSGTAAREQGPFRGLLPFTEEHAALYHGRAAEVASFLERLRLEPSLAVVGPSGAGKSSFVQAGVIPRLHEQGRWLVLSLRPGRDPFAALAARLRSASSSRRPTAEVDPAPVDPAELAAALLETPGRLALELRQLAERHRARVLLFVDQLEELYAQVEDVGLRRRFLHAVSCAADDPQDPVRVIFTLRDDFLGRVAETAEMRETLRRLIVLRSPGREALAEILTHPLRSLDYGYDDPELVAEMIASVEDEPACLPLLQFAARALWEQRDVERRLLLRSAYQAMGGVGGALATHAELVLGELSPVELRAARQILLRLISPEGTRRSSTHAALVEGLDSGGAEGALRRLVDARLLATRSTGASEGGDAEYELAHESLIQRWGKLVHWIEESHEERGFLADVGLAAELWRRRGSRADEVWRGEALEDARRVARRCRTAIPELVKRFLATGTRRERRGRRLRLAAAVAVVVAAVSLLGFWVRTQSRQRARAEELASTAALSTAKSRLAGGDTIGARAWLRQALEHRDTPEARRSWWASGEMAQVWELSLPTAIADIHFAPDSDQAALVTRGGAVLLAFARTRRLRPLGPSRGASAVRFAPDGRSLAVGSSDGAVILLDPVRGTLLHALGAHGTPVESLRFDPTGQQLCSLSMKAVTCWDLRDPTRSARRIVAPFMQSVAAIASGPRTASGVDRVEVRDGFDRATAIHTLARYPRDMFLPCALASGGSRLACQVAAETSIVLSDLKSGVQSVAGMDERVYRIGVSDDGKRVVAGGEREIRLFDSSARQLRRIAPEAGRVTALALSPDGRLLLSGHTKNARLSEGTAFLWNLAAENGVSTGQGESVIGLAFSSDGSRILSAGSLGGLAVWERSSGRRVLQRSAHEGAITLAACARGRAVSAGEDRWIRWWDAHTGAMRHELRREVRAVDLACSEGGERLATADDDQRVRLLGSRGEELLRIDYGAPVHSVAFHPDGGQLVVGGAKGARVYALPEGKRDERWDLTDRIPAVSPLAVAFSRVGEIAVQTEGLITFHQAGVAPRRLRITNSWVRPAFSPLRRLFASTATFSRGGPRELNLVGAIGAGLLLFDLEAGEERRLFGHRGALLSVAFSPDGAFVASGGVDRSVRLWDPGSARAVWRAPLLTGSPPRLFSHRGILDLDRGVVLSPSAPWERRVQDEARLADLDRARGRLCLQAHDGRILLLDLSSGRTLFERSAAAVEKLVLHRDGCATVDPKRRAVIHRAGGVGVLGEGVRELTTAGDALLVIRDERIELHGPPGQPTSHPLPAGVTAAHLAGRELLLGLEDGRIARMTLGEDPATVSARWFESADGGSVISLSQSSGLAIAGYSTGVVAVWDLETRRRLVRFQLNGAVVHLARGPDRLYVATALGDHRVLDLSAIELPYCDLMRRIWRELPEAWGEESQIVGVLPEHRCR